MKCPKCGYFGPDSLNTCKKCGKELFAEKAKFGFSSSVIRRFRPRPTPQKQPVPSSVPISPYTLQEKTSPLFTPEPSEVIVGSPSVKSKNISQDFSPESLEMTFEEQKKEIDEEFKTTLSFQTEHRDTFQGQDTPNITMSPTEIEDFEFPEDLTKKSPPLSVLSENKELLLPDEHQQKKIDLPLNDLFLNEKNVKKQGDTRCCSCETRGEFLNTKNSLPDDSSGDTSPDKGQTEYINGEEISQILQDINHGKVKPDPTT